MMKMSDEEEENRGLYIDIESENEEEEVDEEKRIELADDKEKDIKRGIREGPLSKSAVEGATDFLGNFTTGSLLSSSERFQIEFDEVDEVNSIDSIKHLITSLKKKPPTLLQALEFMEYGEKSGELSEMLIKKAEEKLQDFDAPDLTVEDIASILCYTFEWDKERYGNTDSPYRKLNNSLSVDRSKTTLKKTRYFLFLLLRALRKLPHYVPENRTLYRGIKTRVQTELDPKFPDRLPYAAGNEKTWWTFSSTTETLEVAKLFIKRKSYTLFTLSGSTWGYDISVFSDFPEEKEVLLEPERKLSITNVVRSKKSVSVNAVVLDSPVILLDIIKMMKTVKFKIRKLIKEVPEGLTVQNTATNSVKLSWNPVEVDKRTVHYRVVMRKTGPTIRRNANTVYEGVETYCVVENLNQSTEYEFKLCCGYGGLWGKLSSSVTAKTSAVGWREFSDVVDKKYEVSEKNPRIATNIGEYVYCSIIGNTTLPPNKVTSWNIKILKSRDSNGYGINIGVAPPDINQDGDYNYGKCGWYLHCYNLTLYSGPPHSYDGKVYGPRKDEGQYVDSGDKVCVIMDTEKGNLSFVVGGMNYGIAYEGIPLDNPLAPCVLLLYKNDSVELII